MKRFRFLISAMLILLLVVSAAGPAGSAGPGDSLGEHVPGRVLLQFKPGLTAQVKADILAKHGLTETGKVYGTETLILDSKGNTAALIKALSKNPNVAMVEPDYIAHTTWTPNDTYWSLQWGPQKVSAPAAWDITRGSSGVMIAVVDTGVDLNHPDLNAKVRTDIDIDYVNYDYSAWDDNGHGTHVAGIAAAETNNSTGVAGMCPNCTILPIKVLNANGSGTYSAIASGIRYAADRGAEVINLSLGGSSGSSTLRDAVQYADSRGSLLVCAAGNSNTSAPSYPAYYSECVTVAATDQNDNKASFSNYGSWVDTSAPGVDIASTYWNDTYVYLSGTSMATPHVAGLAGMLFSQGRSKSSVRTRLTSSTYTDPVGSSSIPRRINAYKAVAY